MAQHCISQNATKKGKGHSTREQSSCHRERLNRNQASLFLCDSEVAEAEGHKNKERANAVIHHRNRKESRA
jgi:hypothetical protein